MELIRQQEFVQGFHYDALPEDHTEETAINVSLNPFEIKEEMNIDAQKNSVLGLRIEFKIVLDKVILSGDVAQFVQVVDQKIEKIEDLSSEEVNELVRPLFVLIERMAFELTEIALDAPGVQLNFSQE
ncbi:MULTISPECIES: DUF1149 family protein [Vagococcus]|uniref:DUF1149 family protein n=1 Tax=Vagococcus fluvialis bH819 TaxID=1255619 RepID=A0A1X6WNR6_9ENTE|nr:MULTISPECIES: DUF1149 family protein [Vagococcus]SLM85316.1 hypothetical protein FM121_04410 [Vagococcus fluvialis bH819]HCM89389.1 DUF1149 domain-containing protein [Vagococcus sp.]